MSHKNSVSVLVKPKLSSGTECRDTPSCVMNKYFIQKVLGKGAFGIVYLATRLKDNLLVAIKVEKKDTSISRLVIEYNIYKKLISGGFIDGIPRIYDMLETQNYNMMTMELLGQTLDDLHNHYDKKFSISSVLYIGINVINLMEKLHSVGFIHRDIKPSNFLIGYKKPQKIYLADFGLSKEYIKNNEHIRQAFKKSMIGTARYSSINMHLGIEPSRRDDLESIGYMLIYFHVGKLPWQGLKGTSKKTFFEKIGDVKLSISLDQLCSDVPTCFMDYIKYCRNLQFAETPNYYYLKKLFFDEINKNNYVCQYEWLV